MKNKHWITQEELNKRLIACGYGHSLYPANFWSKEDLEQIEKGEKINFAKKLFGNKEVK